MDVWSNETFEEKNLMSTSTSRILGTVLEFTPYTSLRYSLFAPRPGMEDKPENYFTMSYSLTNNGETHCWHLNRVTIGLALAATARKARRMTKTSSRCFSYWRDLRNLPA